MSSSTINITNTISHNSTVKGRVVFADNPYALRDWDAAKNTAAGNGDPHQMPASVARKIHFHCTDCDHDYQRWATEAFKASDSKPCCIYCAKFPTAPLCANADPDSKNHCLSCFGRSYAGVAAAHASNVCWTWSSAKNDMAPHEAHAYGRAEAVFDCDRCHHEFRFSLSKISLKAAAAPKTKVCPFCAGRDVCDDLECTVCAAERRLRQGAPKKSAPPDRATVEENRRNGVNECVCCKETKPLLAFGKNNHKNPNAPVRNTCMQCHNRGHNRRAKILEVDTLAAKPIPMRTCRECGVAKLANAFHIVDRTEECLECYDHRVTSKLVGGQIHQGPRPEGCRSCQLVFTEDNASAFHYCVYQRKYVDECTACRSSRTASFRRKNMVDEKMDDIRHRAKLYKLLFCEADANAMRRKLTMPCVYCGEAPFLGQLGGLDRVDSSHGYSHASTVPSCADCNYKKKALSLDEFRLKMLHHGPVLEQEGDASSGDGVAAEEGESGCKRQREGDNDSAASQAAAPKKARKVRKARAGKNTSIVFYNLHTGAIAQRVTTLAEAGAVADITFNHVCTKLSNNDTSVWIEPDWSARRDDAPATGVIEDPAEHARLVAAITLRRKLPTRTVETYRMVHNVTGITSMEGVPLSRICRVTKVLKADVLELFRQALRNAEGVCRIGPFHHYFLEEIQREESML